jgi:hypothetical protein
VSGEITHDQIKALVAQSRGELAALCEILSHATGHIHDLQTGYLARIAGVYGASTDVRDIVNLVASTKVEIQIQAGAVQSVHNMLGEFLGKLENLG